MVLLTHVFEVVESFGDVYFAIRARSKEILTLFRYEYRFIINRFQITALSCVFEIITINSPLYKL